MSAFAFVCLAVAVAVTVLWRKARRRIHEIEQQHVRTHRQDESQVTRMRHRAEMLHRIVDGIDDGLFIVGQDLRVAFVNRSAELFFPPVRDPVGRTLLECVRDHRIVELVSEAVEQGQRARQEFLVSSSSAGLTVEDHVFSVEAIPLNGDAPEGLEGALLVILRDETEKHTLEKIRKDFVANASHELRTPLSIINGYLENLTDGDISEPQEAKRAFNIMRKHGDRLARIIEDLLVISRMESGAPDAVKKECFDLKACAEDVIHRLTPMMTTKEARVTVLLDDGASPMIYGDRYYWDQILFNLVSNALKENPARGLEVIISLKQQADMSEIQVRDNGVGIPHADLPFVFKRFYRVRRHYGTEVKGTGLGLSIVKRAVEAHQGKITLHSKPGIETVFTIRVPREPCGAPGLSLTTA